MTEEPALARVVRFGDIEANLDSGEIVRSGRRVVLPEQPLRILVRLLDRPGEVISRDELRRELWSDDTFVDFEHGLNSAVKRLRDALGDSADAPRCVETIPRRGYRFIGTLDRAPDPGAREQPRVGPAASRARAVLRRRTWLVTSVLLVLGAGAIGWRAWTASRPGGIVEAISPNRVLVTVLDGQSSGGSLSPEAKLIADHLVSAISRVETAEVLPTPQPSSSSEDTVAAARRIGAGLGVEVVSHTGGAHQVLEARIHDAGSGVALYFSPRFSQSAASPDEALQQLGQAVAGAVAIHLDHAFGGLQVTSEPPVLAAYLEYRAGGELLERDYPRAIARLQRAAEISPGFLLPRLTLAMAYDNQRDRANTERVMAEIADGTNRLTKAEKLLVEYMTESLARRPASALRALLEAEDLAPRSWIVNYGIQQEAVVLNRPRVAIDAFSRLPLHESYRRFNAWRLAILTKALHLAGEYDRELAESQRAQEYEPGNLLYAADEVRPLAALGRIDSVMRLIDETLSTPTTIGDPVLVIERAARELRAHGHGTHASEVANRGVDWLRSRPPSNTETEGHRAALARMLYHAERWDDAAREFRRLAADRPDSVEYAGHLGAIAARRPDRREALGFDDQLHAMSSSDHHGRHTYWRACIASLLGDRDHAVALLREAFAQGHYRGLQIHESAELEPLRDFPPFASLVSPRE